MKNKAVKILALVIGILSMTFSGLNWQVGILAWIAPICLLFYTRNSGEKGFFLFFGLLSLAGYFSQTCTNIFNLFIVNLINGLSYAIVYTIIYGIDKILYKRGKGFFSTLIFPSVFVSFEFLLSKLVGTSGIVAQSQIEFKVLVQLSTITGIFGISFMILWFSAVINWIIENRYTEYIIRKALFVYGGVFFIILLFGISRLKIATEIQSSVKVASISGETKIFDLVEKEQSEFTNLANNPQLEIPRRFFAYETIIQNQLKNTTEAAKSGAKIIVWNEFALVLNQRQVDSILVKVKSISKDYNAYILLAFLEEDISSSTKPFNNKSILITSNGELAWEYLKSNLTPSEIPIINPGSQRIPFMDTEYGRIGSVTCYDLDFPTFLQQAGKNSIDIMLVPSYDWENYEVLHSNMACLEALQSGFSMIRSNGEGINMICDCRGNVIAQMNTFTSNSNVLYAELPLNKANTVYSKVGNVFSYFLILFFLVIVGFRIVRR